MNTHCPIDGSDLKDGKCEVEDKWWHVEAMEYRKEVLKRKKIMEAQKFINALQ